MSHDEIRKKRSVLVVDGDARDLYATSMLAQNFGYTATGVRTVEEARVFLSIATPALIITELLFPGTSGSDLLDHIKRDPAASAIPVIIQTGFSEPESEERCKQIGCVSYIKKPVTVDGLYRAIQSAIEKPPRRYLRVTTYFPVFIDGAGTKTELVTDLSDDGIFIKTLTPRLSGSRHSVSFTLGTRLIRAEAVVLYTYGFGEGPNREPGMGMKFMNLGREDKAAIQEYVRDQVKPDIVPKRLPE